MKKSTASCLLLLALLAVPRIAFGEQSQEQPAIEKNDTAKETNRPFTVLVVDQDGKPVADAFVGRGATRISHEDWQFFGLATQRTSKGFPRTAKAAITDAEGRTQMFVEDVLASKASRAIVARQASRTLVGIATVSREALLAASKDESVITVSLQPECRVHGQVRGKGLRSWGGIVELDRNRIFTFVYSEEADLECYLPPGTYSLTLNGESDTPFLEKSITVPAATAELDLGSLDLPPGHMATMIGEPAPEIAEVVAWKNSEPLKLADLHGKYVLLDFWGCWCGPCIRNMPKLFALHDKFAKKGLVIIGVHVGLDDKSIIDSTEKLDTALLEKRKQFWDGRDLPFPVAMVAFREIKHLGSRRVDLSQASVDFGIQSYPSQVLIDPEGKVIGWFNEKEHLKLFEALPDAE